MLSHNSILGKNSLQFFQDRLWFFSFGCVRFFGRRPALKKLKAVFLGGGMLPLLPPFRFLFPTPFPPFRMSSIRDVFPITVRNAFLKTVRETFEEHEETSEDEFEIHYTFDEPLTIVQQKAVRQLTTKLNEVVKKNTQWWIHGFAFLSTREVQFECVRNIPDFSDVCSFLDDFIEDECDDCGKYESEECLPDCRYERCRRVDADAELQARFKRIRDAIAAGKKPETTGNSAGGISILGLLKSIERGDTEASVLGDLDYKEE